jgi:hypothetical protein
MACGDFGTVEIDQFRRRFLDLAHQLVDRLSLQAQVRDVGLRDILEACLGVLGQMDLEFDGIGHDAFTPHGACLAYAGVSAGVARPRLRQAARSRALSRCRGCPVATPPLSRATCGYRSAISGV